MDWESSATEILLNPRIPQEAQQIISKSLPTQGDFSGHIWLATSGSTSAGGESKYVALSKKAILMSAQAVNNHLFSTREDVWLNPLPLFHVGGLGIVARAYLSGARSIAYSGRWKPEEYCGMLTQVNATLTALVPAQLHDLVTGDCKAPASLRAVVVGGGRLNDNLYQRAKALGWPVLPSYGLTEASSQVATAVLQGDSPDLVVLDHVKVAVDDKSFIHIKGDSLLTAYACLRGQHATLYDPKIEGWLCTEDKGALLNKILTVGGRSTDFVKIGGESVDLANLEKILEAIRCKALSRQAIVLLAIPDARLGHTVHAVVEGDIDEGTKVVLDEFQQSVLPFERFRCVHQVEAFHRTPLGKIQKALLMQNIAEKLRNNTEYRL